MRTFFGKAIYLYLILWLGLAACTPTAPSKAIDSAKVQLFKLLSPSETNFHFKNELVENNRINILNYLYYYNGSGVAIGDINQDGLADIYMGSTTQKNKLFLNKGNLTFEDISQTAGVGGEFGITTGVSFIDINNDGYLDIYICKSGVQSERYRTNELYINNGNLTFTEQAAAYGLADASFSNQAYFFDIDKDNDLDMYLVNHPVDWPNINKIMTGKQNEEGFHYHFSDKLYRNNGQGKFEDITQSAGVLNRSWGLSAAIGDFNGDQYPDIYVANDFIKPDNLYINQKDGSFKDEIQKYFHHISFYSMGTDFADINNDGKNDLYVADMAMNGHTRSKRSMGSMSTENFQTIIRRGYHYPYSSNTLQLQVGKNTYADIAQAVGVAKTDWSWAPLIFDCDNDGLKDIFITNGIYRDIIDNDFLIKKASYDQRDEKNYFDDLVEDIPQSKVKNFLFRNTGNLSFENLSESWGISQTSNSNG
ncbi:MAG: VCBS repeat-containing protein, partial [Bacteroidota bacterium]